jgi:hypothetical protein
MFMSLMGLQPNTKTKKSLNITCHHEDFAVSAEWHFFATSHGKSACGGVDGTKMACSKSKFAVTI